MIHSNDTFAKLRLILDIEGIGPAKLLSLLSKFKNIENLFNSNYQEIIDIPGISNTLSNKIIKQIDAYSKFTESIEKELENLDKIGASWITYWSENYPQNLKNIFAPPIILYYKGNLLKKDNASISIVGTRKASQYGKSTALNISKDISSKGLSVISGLARGIDTIAHKGALQNNGRTIAIIGSGLDVIYPSENKYLFDKIVDNGAVVSEYILGTKPDAQNFPKRNRIISGFSLGTLVVETKPSGGAMQTAAFALEQNREVFAIPGNIGSIQSEGTNLLIQKGEAKLVRNCEDILVELNIKIKPEIGVNIPKPKIELNLFEERIYDILSDKPKHIDKISEESKISSSECLVCLLSLEFRELVHQLPGTSFIKSNNF